MKLAQRLLDLLYPPKCVFCRRLLNRREKGICADCLAALPRTGAGETQKADFIPAVVSPLYYEDKVRQSLLRYKFSGCSFYAPVYGELMAESMRERAEIGFDVIVPVPLSRQRKRQRGYDQAALLAEAVGKRLSTPVRSLLVKFRDVPPQSRAGDAAARRANISGCYAPARDGGVEGQRILLVDDIITTGATLSECARVLRLAGAAEVSALTLARSRE